MWLFCSSLNRPTYPRASLQSVRRESELVPDPARANQQATVGSVSLSDMMSRLFQVVSQTRQDSDTALNRYKTMCGRPQAPTPNRLRASHLAGGGFAGEDMRPSPRS